MTGKKCRPLQTGGSYFYVNNATAKILFENNVEVYMHTDHGLNMIIHMNNDPFC